jgi:hypothetical protein
MSTSTRGEINYYISLLTIIYQLIIEEEFPVLFLASPTNTFYI